MQLSCPLPQVGPVLVQLKDLFGQPEYIQDAQLLEPLRHPQMLQLLVEGECVAAHTCVRAHALCTSRVGDTCAE